MVMYPPTLKPNSSDLQTCQEGSVVSVDQGLESRTHLQPRGHGVSISSLGDMEMECITLTAINISYF